uniref:Ion_trans domain-containing protein n=1 Tax=Macrostomum lignano TaxID=282301 RepID=A0A1I8GRD1_9PLAT
GFVASDRATLAAAATAAAAAAASGAGTANVPHAGRAANSNANHRGDSDSGLSEVSGGSLGRSRRRTLPSLLGSNSARPSTLVGPAELEDSSHSRDRQQSAGAATFIIENGVRKRVLHSISSTAAAAISSPHRYNNRKQNSLPHQRSLRHPQQLQQHRLCRIESQARLCKDLGEGSLPDVSVCRYIVRRGLMSREEAAQLGRQRRLELLKLEEMQNQQRRQRQQQQRAEDGDAVLADVRECKRLPVDDPLHSFVSRGGLRRRLLCSRCASIEPSSNCSTSLRVQDPTTASQHWRRLLLLSLEEPQAATNSGRSSTDSTPSRTTRTSSSTFAAAARLSGAAAAHAFWRVVNWLRLNTGELVQEHFLLLFVLIVNTVLAVLVFHLLNSNAKLP